MKWLKNFFCKLFVCKCGCQEGKECKCSEPKKVTNDENKVTKMIPITNPHKKTAKKKVTKKTTKKAKK